MPSTTRLSGICANEVEAITAMAREVVFILTRDCWTELGEFKSKRPLEKSLKRTRAEGLLAGIEQRHAGTFEIELEEHADTVRAAAVIADGVDAISIRQDDLPCIFR